MSNTLEQEFIDAAIETIDEFIATPNATWIHLGELETPDVDKPWKRTFVPTNKSETAVKIVFLPDELEDRQLAKFFKESAVTVGQVNGFMYPYAAFEPKLEDYILRPYENGSGDETIKIRAIDAIRYFNKTVLYILEFGR